MGCARSRSLLDSCEHVIGVAASSPIMTGTGLYDSLLEEAVSSEPVSEAKFPASWENTGNFVRRGLRVRLLAWNLGPNTTAYDPILYATEQGIYFGLAGN